MSLHPQIFSTSAPSPALSFLSDSLGLLYLLAWSLSFYPQAWETYHRKNVHGLSLEFAFLQPFSYLFYSVYTFSGRLDPQLGTGKVTNADIVFANHGLMMAGVLLT